jgi:hypothetical protein
MKNPFTYYFAALALLVVIVGGAAAYNSLHATPTAGSSDIVILPTYPTMTLLGVGTSDGLVVASSSGRMRLEITNLSGATTTAQALYCNTGDRPAVVYKGIVIQASSTKVFDFGNLPRGAVHCIYPVSAATVTVADW